jgi:hypothetical protein
MTVMKPANMFPTAALAAMLVFWLPACTEKPPAPEISVAANIRPTNPVRASINASLVGQWSGSVASSRYPEAGAKPGTPVRITFAITSTDNLDAAYWGDAVGLNMITYVDAKTRHVRAWSPDGTLIETQPTISDVVAPNEVGNWSFVQTVVQPDAGGGSMEIQTHFALWDGTLTTETMQRPAGSREDFVKNQTVTLVRSPATPTN